jgi:sialic acid synthase SpsE
MKKNKTFIIAEIGINHNGSLSLAKKIVDRAKDAGADAVKFQIFKTENVITKNAQLCNYQKKNSLKKKISLFNLLKKVELSYLSFKKLALYCNKKNIEFMCTADEVEGLNEIKNLIKKVKVGSAELNDYYFLEKIAKLKKITFLSTGLSDIKQVKLSRNYLIKSGLSKKL